MSKRTNRLVWGLAAAASVGIIIGSVAADNPFWTRKDSWFHAPPTRVAQSRWTEEGRSSWKEVREAEILWVTGQMEAKAERMLQNSPIVILRATEAEALLGLPLTFPTGKTPHLVRAVYLNEGTGAFDISYRHSVLWVNHGCLGKHPVPMKRRALVVLLKTTPKQVYVTCSMDE